ncbi:hypothetical protein D3C86_1159070 [compost metagenome]
MRIRRGRRPGIVLGKTRHQGVAAPEGLIAISEERALPDIVDGDGPDIPSAGKAGIKPQLRQHLRKDRIDGGTDGHQREDRQKQGYDRVAPAGPAQDEPACRNDDRHQPKRGLAAGLDQKDQRQQQHRQPADERPALAEINADDDQHRHARGGLVLVAENPAPVSRQKRFQRIACLVDRARGQHGDSEIAQEQYDQRACGEQRREMPLRARQLQETAGKHTDNGAHDKPPERKQRRFARHRSQDKPAENRRHQQARHEEDGKRPLLRHEGQETEKQDDRRQLVEQVGPGRHGGALIGR